MKEEGKKTTNNVIRDVIVANRMYVGDYLTSNLGHEVVNMFKADDGGSYLYLNAYGSFAKKWQYRVKHMLMIKYYSEDCVEVIGKAEIAEDIFNYSDDISNRSDTNDKTISKKQKARIKGIKYCGVSLIDLFSDSERQNVYVTFRAGNTYKVKNGYRILIHYKPQGDDNTHVRKSVISKKEKCIEVWLSKTKLALASLCQYFEPVSDNTDYKILQKIIEDNNPDFWEEVMGVEEQDDKENNEPSLFDICQIQNDENRISNAMAYFMRVPKYRRMWQSFFTEKCDIELGDNYTVVREQDTTIKDGNKKDGDSSKKSSEDNNRGRIDLFISDNNSVLAIENKIKSGINRKSDDGPDNDQLDRYIRYLNHMKDVKKVIDNYRLVVLLPEYNKTEIMQRVNELNVFAESHDKRNTKRHPKPKYEVKVVTYKDLYDFLSTKRDTFKDDSNFMAFFDTIKRHTYNTENEYLYGEMMQKFYDRIRLAKQSSSD